MRFSYFSLDPILSNTAYASPSESFPVRAANLSICSVLEVGLGGGVQLGSSGQFPVQVSSKLVLSTSKYHSLSPFREASCSKNLILKEGVSGVRSNFFFSKKG